MRCTVDRSSAAAAQPPSMRPQGRALRIAMRGRCGSTRIVCAPFSASPACREDGAFFGERALLFGLLRRDSLHALHDDGLARHVVEAAAPAGCDRRNLVDHVRAFGYPCEHRITVITGLVIQKIVVLQVDEEL